MRTRIQANDTRKRRRTGFPTNGGLRRQVILLATLWLTPTQSFTAVVLDPTHPSAATTTTPRGSDNDNILHERAKRTLTGLRASTDVIDAELRHLHRDETTTTTRRKERSSASLVEESEEQDNMPPWLAHYQSFSAEQIQEQLLWLEYALLEHRPDWPMHEILKAVERTAIPAGCCQFLRTLLESCSTEEEGRMLLTQDLLLAAVQHYAECIAVRNRGSIHELVRQIVLKREPWRLGGTEQPQQQQQRLDTLSTPTASPFPSSGCLVWLPKSQGDIESQATSTTTQAADSLLATDAIQSTVRDAARIKRVEILAQVLLPSTELSNNAQTSASLQNLLLSVTDDFRALCLRCVACLFRLEAILRQQQSDNGVDEFLLRSPETIRVAKDGIRVYAILAQRLGLRKLKSRIEDVAFRILYRRQYETVSSLYGAEMQRSMQTLSNYLLSDIQDTLHKDAGLMEQIDDLQITARVKEPYSFWKKLLKKRWQKRLTSANECCGEKGLVLSFPDAHSALSMTHVRDVAALRVVVRARKWNDDEDEETTQARERFLCYYIQHSLRRKWGATRLKDYIRFPKQNGYQSLHHTSYVTDDGIKFPFEVQIRSEAMHKAAEYGCSNHWNYKLGRSLLTVPGERSTPSVLSAEEETVATPSTTSTAVPNTGLASLSPTGSYLDALVTAKKAMKKNIYVFMAGHNKAGEEGKLVSLPGDAVIQDALFAMESTNVTDHSASDKMVYRNGRVAGLKDSVEVGDVLLISR